MTAAPAAGLPDTGGTVGRVLIIVQNLPVPFDRRVWLECRGLTAAGYEVSVIAPRGRGESACQVIDGVRIYRYRPYAPGGSAAGFVAEYGWSFLATTWLTLKARRRGRFRRSAGLQPAGHLLADRAGAEDRGPNQVRLRPSRPVP